MIVKNYISEYSAILESCKWSRDEREEDTFEKYYRLYEYADDIRVLEDNPLYPCLINYVKTGILTEVEMIKALLM